MKQLRKTKYIANQIDSLTLDKQGIVPNSKVQSIISPEILDQIDKVIPM